MVMAELRVTRRFSITAGYGFTYMPSVTVDHSNFEPGAAAQCDAAQGDTGAASCNARLQGRARPAAEGSYARSEHDFSASMTARF